MHLLSILKHFGFSLGLGVLKSTLMANMCIVLAELDLLKKTLGLYLYDQRSGSYVFKI